MHDQLSEEKLKHVQREIKTQLETKQSENQDLSAQLATALSEAAEERQRSSRLLDGKASELETVLRSHKAAVASQEVALASKNDKLETVLETNHQVQ